VQLVPHLVDDFPPLCLELGFVSERSAGMPAERPDLQADHHQLSTFHSQAPAPGDAGHQAHPHRPPQSPPAPTLFPCSTAPPPSSTRAPAPRASVRLMPPAPPPSYATRVLNPLVLARHAGASSPRKSEERSEEDQQVALIGQP
jgi:hypothetical protein